MRINPVKMLELLVVFSIGFWLIVSGFVFLRVAAHRDSPSLIDFLIMNLGRRFIQANFSSIQEAINKAENGSTIYVPSAVYYERIVINKTISLIGENASTTIIDGSSGGTVVGITADDVTIADFTLQNSGWGWFKNGIYVYRADNCEIKNNFLFYNCQNIRLNHSQNSRVFHNTIAGDGYGIRLINSVNCTAIGNNVSNCIAGVHLQNATGCTVKGNNITQNSQGVRLYSPCSYNNITANTVYNNTYDGTIEKMPPNGTFFNNFIYHNNFINNTNPFIHVWSGNIWDDGYPSGGNHWSRYNGTDIHSGPYQNQTCSDGIGDTPYAVNSYDVDRYPLMRPYGSVRNINTNLTYLTIQSAVDASETLDGHTLRVDPGIYSENVNIHKPLTLIGENKTTTVIDGGNTGTVLSVNADNVNVINFTICNSGFNFPPYGDDCGVLLNHSVGSNIRHCLITSNRIGLYLFFSQSCLIDDNIISSNYENGVLLWHSSDNVLNQNEIFNNSYNFGVFGGGFSNFNNTVDVSNTVDGKPINYVVGSEDEVFDNQTSIGVLYLINCLNITVRNLNLTKNGHGLFWYNVTDSRIENVTASENCYGIYLQASNDNIVNNSCCFKNWVGIQLYKSDYNVVENNIAGDCEKGISLYEASHNYLRRNTILNNLYGIRFSSSHLNSIFHNNLVENSEQADLVFSYQNVWDNGCEGNYWSDYNGTDSNGDGIGDTELPWLGIDNYPLMNLYWSPADINHDLAVNLYDAVWICLAFGSQPGDPNWNPRCDIAEPYNVVDEYDLMIVCMNYGRRCDCH